MATCIYVIIVNFYYLLHFKYKSHWLIYHQGNILLLSYTTIDFYANISPSDKKSTPATVTALGSLVLKKKTYKIPLFFIPASSAMQAEILWGGLQDGQIFN